MRIEYFALAIAEKYNCKMFAWFVSGPLAIICTGEILETL